MSAEILKGWATGGTASGMTMRDSFAAHAMQAYAPIWNMYVQAAKLDDKQEAVGIAEIAYLVADAMLARSKK